MIIHRSYCINLCDKLSVKKSIYKSEPYKKGLKFCRRCDVFLRHKRHRCPCCGMQLRVNPLVKH